MSAISKYLAAIGRRGGEAGKGSAAKAASAKKANAARWKGHRKAERVPAKPNDQAHIQTPDSDGGAQKGQSK